MTNTHDGKGHGEVISNLKNDPQLQLTSDVTTANIHVSIETC